MDPPYLSILHVDTSQSRKPRGNWHSLVFSDSVRQLPFVEEVIANRTDFGVALDKTKTKNDFSEQTDWGPFVQVKTSLDIG